MHQEKHQANYLNISFIDSSAPSTPCKETTANPICTDLPVPDVQLVIKQNVLPNYTKDENIFSNNVNTNNNNSQDEDDDEKETVKQSTVEHNLAQDVNSSEKVNLNVDSEHVILDELADHLEKAVGKIEESVMYSESIQFRSESPPSLVLSNDNSFVIDDDDDDDVIDDDFNNDDFAKSPTKDESFSMPSLKLDSIHSFDSIQSNEINSDVHQSAVYADSIKPNSTQHSLDSIQSNQVTDLSVEIEDCTLTEPQQQQKSATALEFNSFSTDDNKFNDRILDDQLVDAESQLDESSIDTAVKPPPDDSFDDFIEYNESRSPVKLPNTMTTVEPDAVISNAFDADFSQFNAFQQDDEIILLPDHSEKEVEKDNDKDKENEFKDDFNDFKSSNTVTENVVDDNDDDDFGDFSDFSQQQQQQQFNSHSITTNLEQIKEIIPNLLETMFPAANAIDVVSAEDDKFGVNIGSNDLLVNRTISGLKDFDNSKALDYQWVSSKGKTALVTSLGIDSRNIVRYLFYIYVPT